MTITTTLHSQSPNKKEVDWQITIFPTISIIRVKYLNSAPYNYMCINFEWIFWQYEINIDYLCK